jgi:hypothetical protein
MKLSSILALLIAVIANSIASAGISDLIYGRSWEFMESVGGIAINTPIREADGTVTLPVKCDVSGLTTTTKKPTIMNSALVVTGIDKRIEKEQIYISVNTGMVSKNATCICPSIDLGNIPSGDYQVYYQGSDRVKYTLGKVTVPAK